MPHLSGSVQRFKVWQRSVDLVVECYKLRVNCLVMKSLVWFLKSAGPPPRCLPISLKVTEDGTAGSLLAFSPLPAARSANCKLILSLRVVSAICLASIRSPRSIPSTKSRKCYTECASALSRTPTALKTQLVTENEPRCQNLWFQIADR